MPALVNMIRDEGLLTSSLPENERAVGPELADQVVAEFGNDLHNDPFLSLRTSETHAGGLSTGSNR
jgi:hypothetical protein